MKLLHGPLSLLCLCGKLRRLFRPVPFYQISGKNDSCGCRRSHGRFSGCGQLLPLGSILTAVPFPALGRQASILLLKSPHAPFHPTDAVVLQNI